MANATRDQNSVPVLLCALNTNGTTLVQVKASPTTHTLSVSVGTSGVDHGTQNAGRDENSHPVLLATSSSDGKTLVEVYADSSGNILMAY